MPSGPCADGEHLAADGEQALAAFTSSQKVGDGVEQAVAIVVADQDQRPVLARGDDLAELVERHGDQRAGLLGIDDPLDAELAAARLKRPCAPATVTSLPQGSVAPIVPKLRAASHCESLKRALCQPTNSFSDGLPTGVGGMRDVRAPLLP